MRTPWASDRVVYRADRVGLVMFPGEWRGWLYLATVIDMCTRMVVGWAMADHMRSSLVTGALAMARDRGHLAPNSHIPR